MNTDFDSIFGERDDDAPQSKGRDPLLYLGDSKRCSKCGKYKLFSEFRKDRDAARGITSACKACLVDRKHKSYEDRFWKHFRSKVEQVGDCLEWQGMYSNRKPICTWKKHRNTSLRRVVYRLALGDVPENMVVITTCNNTRCVRQAHMKLVTKEAFMAKLNNSAATGDRNGSRTRPDRQVRGERHGAAKLTAASVREIKKLRQLGLSEPAIAKQLGVSRGAINNIFRGQTWKHVQ